MVDSTAEEKPKEERPVRAYSEASRARLETLAELEAKIKEIEAEVDLCSDNSLKEPVPTKHRLAQVVGLLDELQFSEIDGILTVDLQSGQTTAKQRRKDLHGRVDAARERVQKLLAEIDASGRLEDQPLSKSVDVECSEDDLSERYEAASAEILEEARKRSEAARQARAQRKSHVAVRFAETEGQRIEDAAKTQLVNALFDDDPSLATRRALAKALAAVHRARQSGHVSAVVATQLKTMLLAQGDLPKSYVSHILLANDDTALLLVLRTIIVGEL